MAFAAETWTVLAASRKLSRCRGGSRSILFMTQARFAVCFQLLQHFFDLRVLLGGERVARVETCRTSSARCTSSSVARKAETRVCGRSRINPTVSDSNTWRREGSVIPRMVGSSVANIFGDSSTAACVSALNKVDFPARWCSPPKRSRLQEPIRAGDAVGYGCGERFRSALLRVGCGDRFYADRFPVESRLGRGCQCRRQVATFQSRVLPVGEACIRAAPIPLATVLHEYARVWRKCRG